MRARCLLSVLVVLLALPAVAQQYPSQARGLGASVAYQTGDVDHVNLFNGQLSITLPLGQGYPVGPGFGSGLAFTYTSSLGKLEEPIAPDTRWRYFSPDGGEVIFYPTLHPGFPAAGAQPNVFFSNDSSYRRLRQSSSTAQCDTVPGTATACRLLESPRKIRFSERIHRPLGTVFGSEGFQPLAGRGTSAQRVTEVTRYHTPALAGRRAVSSLLIDTLAASSNPDRGTLTVINPDTSQLGDNFSFGSNRKAGQSDRRNGGYRQAQRPAQPSPRRKTST